MNRQHVTDQFRIGVWPGPWGPMGAVLGPEGLIRTTVPGGQPEQIRELLLWQYPGAVSDDAALAELAEACRQALRGQWDPAGRAPVDLSSLGAFTQRVLERTREIAPGQTLSCSQLAEVMNERGKAVQIATAINANPIPLVVPCHRVVGVSRPPVDRPELGPFRQRLREAEQS